MRWLFVIAILLSTLNLVAQPELPPVISLRQADDYDKFEKLAVASMDWLLKTPLDTMEVERSRLNVFCMEWLTGHPKLRLEINSSLMPYMGKHPELIYVHCYAAALEQMSNPACSQLDYNETGVRAVLKTAGMTKGLTSCETLSNMIEAADNNQLKAWVEGRLSP